MIKKLSSEPGDNYHTCLLEDLERQRVRARQLFVILSLSAATVQVIANFCLTHAADLFLSEDDSLSVSSSTSNISGLTNLDENMVFGYIILCISVGLNVISVPVTHLAGVVLHQEKSYHFFQPLEGGQDYVVLQAFAWLFYSLMLLIVLIVPFTNSHLRGTFTLAGVFGSISQVLITCSLLMYNFDTVSDSFSGDSREQRSPSLNWPNEGDWPSLVEDLWTANNGNELHFFSIDVGTACFILFVFLELSLLLCPFVLVFFSNVFSSDAIIEVNLALLSCFLSIMFSIGLSNKVGVKLWARFSGASLFRPFVGGFFFCCFQFLTWFFLLVSLSSQLLLIATLFNLKSILSTWIFGDDESLNQLFTLKSGVTAAVASQIFLALTMKAFSSVDEDDIVSKSNRLAQNYYLEKIDESMKEEEKQKHIDFIQSVDSLMQKLSGLHLFLVGLFLGLLHNIYYVLFIPIIAFFDAPSLLISKLNGDEEIQEFQKYNSFPLVSFVSCFLSFAFMYSILTTLKARPGFKHSVLALITIIPMLLTLYFNKDSPAFQTVCFWCMLHVIYILLTYKDSPERTGRREWKFIQNEKFWNTIMMYYASQVVKDELLIKYEKENGLLGTTDCKRFILGCHPHGIIPSSFTWLPLSTQWKQMFPSIKARTHTATVIHAVPVLRDLAQWMGIRDVARTTVEYSVAHNVCPMLVIGGQSEMFLSTSKGTEFHLHRRHKGFARLAIKHNVGLVPVFSYGEQKLMDNVDFPKCQAYFKHLLGFPIPFLPYGRFYLPMPRRTKITVVVGAPIFPLKQTSRPTEAEVHEFHSRYFTELEALFERNKAKAGFPKHSIKWHQ